MYCCKPFFSSSGCLATLCKGYQSNINPAFSTTVSSWEISQCSMCSVQKYLKKRGCVGLKISDGLMTDRLLLRLQYPLFACSPYSSTQRWHYFIDMYVLSSSLTGIAERLTKCIGHKLTDRVNNCILFKMLTEADINLTCITLLNGWIHARKELKILHTVRVHSFLIVDCARHVDQ